MVRDHRPYILKKTYRLLEDFYIRRFLRPQLKTLGPAPHFMKPWHVELFGWPIEIGRCVHVIATPDMKVRLSVWSADPTQGRITIGDYCLICPGVRLGSASAIDIGDNCMLAHGVYITDSDWHEVYNRIQAPTRSTPVRIHANVWIGDSAIICKGVTIGENSVIGAGAVVVNDVPANTIAAGNPARVVKHLDPNEKMVTRADWYKNPEKLFKEIARMDRKMLEANTWGHWLRYKLFPRPGE